LCRDEVTAAGEGSESGLESYYLVRLNRVLGNAEPRCSGAWADPAAADGIVGIEADEERSEQVACLSEALGLAFCGQLRVESGAMGAGCAYRVLAVLGEVQQLCARVVGETPAG
jgi:hypothetical protein